MYVHFFISLFQTTLLFTIVYYSHNVISNNSVYDTVVYVMLLYFYTTDLFY